MKNCFAKSVPNCGWDMAAIQAAALRSCSLLQKVRVAGAEEVYDQEPGPMNSV